MINTKVLYGEYKILWSHKYELLISMRPDMMNTKQLNALSENLIRLFDL